MDRFTKLGMVSVFCLALIGCASVGPRQIMYNRNDYNTIIRDTDDQQLLLNIVRLRYLEPIGFLQISNIAGSTSISSNLNFGSSWTPLINEITQSFSPSAGVSYSESPTVSYMPLSSADFIKQLMAPIALESAYLLAFGGINDSLRLSRMIFQSVGDYDNAASSANTRKITVPNITNFNKLLEPIEWLERNDAYRYFKDVEGTSVKLVMYFKKKYYLSPAAMKLKRLLGVPSDSMSIVFSQAPDVNDKREILVQTRSILGTLLFLSHAVEVPESDLKKGVVIQNKYPDGRPYNWGNLMNGLLKVHCSEARPMSSAFVKVYYRGHWFYISDADADSKITFTILSQLVAIAAGANTGESNAPVFTLPVGPPQPVQVQR